MSGGGTPRLYICAGMRRSGSTLQSQLVCALLGVEGPPTTSFDAARELLTRPDGVMVLKCHKYAPEAEAWLAGGKAKVVCSYRDIRDVVASICRKYSLPAFGYIGGGAEGILHEYGQWARLPCVHVARYEDMVADLTSEIERLAAFLDVSVDRARATELAAEFAPDRQQARIRSAFETGEVLGQGANVRDAGSLLHRNHIQSGAHGAYRQVLRRHESAALEWSCRHWLREHGYQTDSWWLTGLLAHAWFRSRAMVNLLRRQAFDDKAEKST